MSDAKRVALAGNNTAAVHVLHLLLERLPPESVLVIAPPQPPGGTWQQSLADAASERGVECVTPENVNDELIVGRIREHAPQLLLSVYYTQLFGQELLGTVDGPLLNFHPSLLPRHRGHAPIIWAIADGDDVTGLSVHHIDAGIDTGRLVYRLPIPIHPDETGFELHGKLALLVRATAADLLRRWLAGEELPHPEDQAGKATSHSRRDPQLNHIDWNDPAERIRNVVRALAPPLPGAYAEHGGDRIVLADVERVAGPVGLAPRIGMVEPDADGWPVVGAGDGLIRIRTVWRAGPVDARDIGLARGAVLA